MRSIKDEYRNKRFYFNDYAIVVIEGKTYKTYAYYGPQKTTWIHPFRLTKKAFSALNPKINFEPIKKLQEKFQKMRISFLPKID